MAQYYPTLDDFRGLTHLSVPFCYGTHDTAVLSRWIKDSKLEMLVVVVLEDLIGREDEERLKAWREVERISNLSETKIKIVSSKSDRLTEDWEFEVRGGQSIWDVDEDNQL